MKPDWESDCGRVALWCRDCLDVLPGLEAGSVDAVVTDPPYGIGISRLRTIGKSKVNDSTVFEPSSWDDAPLNADQWREIRRVSDEQIVFGGNYLTDVLGPSRGWLVWDKKCRNGWQDNFSDCEIAWSSIEMPARVFRHLWMGAMRESERLKGQKFHPAQKPVALMRWCLGFTSGKTILDPFCGVGTTGVACIKTGRRFLGVEREPRYFAVAVKRIKAALADERASLFPAAKEDQ